MRNEYLTVSQMCARYQNSFVSFHFQSKLGEKKAGNHARFILI